MGLAPTSPVIEVVPVFVTPDLHKMAKLSALPRQIRTNGSAPEHDVGPELGEVLGEALGGVLGPALGEKLGAVDGPLLGEADGPTLGEALVLGDELGRTLGVELGALLALG